MCPWNEFCKSTRLDDCVSPMFRDAATARPRMIYASTLRLYTFASFGKKINEDRAASMSCVEDHHLMT